MQNFVFLLHFIGRFYIRVFYVLLVHVFNFLEKNQIFDVSLAAAAGTTLFLFFSIIFETSENQPKSSNNAGKSVIFCDDVILS